MLEKTLKFIIRKHYGQLRKKTKIPYIIHPIIVSVLLKKYKPFFSNYDELYIVALLHDTLEDTNTTYDEIVEEFNVNIANLVLELSNDKEIINVIGKNEYLKQKVINLSSNALTIKLIDRLSNIIDKAEKKYLYDTIELINYLLYVRHDLNNVHKNISYDILYLCKVNLKNY